MDPAMTIAELLKTRRDEILAIAERHGASNVRIFGSVARGEAGPDSDVDLLVDLERGRTLIDHGQLQVDLEGLLGRKVDVVTERGLLSHLRARVLEEAVPL
jgi:predicted nucleotidyltransferase